jgi:hypothetical protein
VGWAAHRGAVEELDLAVHPGEGGDRFGEVSGAAFFEGVGRGRTSAACSRRAVAMQSAAVSPPPITATCLPAALMVGSAGSVSGRAWAMSRLCWAR